MTGNSRADEALRCLQQLSGGGPQGLDAAEVALREGMPLEAAGERLQALCRAGLVHEAEGGAYRLALPPERIAVADVCRAVGVAPAEAGGQPGLTLAHLLEWERRVFESESTARAA